MRTELEARKIQQDLPDEDFSRFPEYVGSGVVSESGGFYVAIYVTTDEAQLSTEFRESVLRFINEEARRRNMKVDAKIVGVGDLRFN